MIEALQVSIPPGPNSAADERRAVYEVEAQRSLAEPSGGGDASRGADRDRGERISSNAMSALGRPIATGDREVNAENLRSIGLSLAGSSARGVLTEISERGAPETLQAERRRCSSCFKDLPPSCAVGAVCRFYADQLTHRTGEREIGLMVSVYGWMRENVSAPQGDHMQCADAEIRLRSRHTSRALERKWFRTQAKKCENRCAAWVEAGGPARHLRGVPGATFAAALYWPCADLIARWRLGPPFHHRAPELRHREGK